MLILVQYMYIQPSLFGSGVGVGGSVDAMVCDALANLYIKQKILFNNVIL